MKNSPISSTVAIPYKQGIIFPPRWKVIGIVAFLALAALIVGIAFHYRLMDQKMSAKSLMIGGGSLLGIIAIISLILYRRPLLTYQNFLTLEKKFNGLNVINTRAWIVLKKENSIENDKIHISINRLDLSKAFELLFPKIIAHFDAFKITKPDSGGNTLGKEFVLYIPKEMSKQQLESILKEFVKTLERAGIRPGFPSQADLCLEGGGGFLYSRAAFNIFGAYLVSTFFEEADFTATESATIGPSMCLELNLGNKSTKKTDAAVADIPERFAPSADEIMARAVLLKKKFLEDLMTPIIQDWRIDGQEITNVDNIFFLLQGAEVRTRKMPVENELLQFFHANDPKIINFKNGDIFQTPANIKFLEPLLEKAAHLAAHIQLSLFKDPQFKSGNILPVIYHHLIIPLANNYSQSGKLELRKNEERGLICELVKCSFRQRGAQSTQKNPLYIEGITDELLETEIAIFNPLS